jgi:Protein of unknown function (DUF2892)
MHFKINKNIGTQGRILRFILAALLLLLGWLEHNWILLAISLFVFFEGLASWCVVNQILGKNSCPTKKD